MYTGLFAGVFERWIHQFGIQGLIKPSRDCLSRFHDLEQEHKSLDPSSQWAHIYHLEQRV